MMESNMTHNITGLTPAFVTTDGGVVYFGNAPATGEKLMQICNEMGRCMGKKFVVEKEKEVRNVV